jgi:hypothetical protein
VSVIDQASGVVLGQVQVEEKGSEVAAYATLLDTLDLREVLVTADTLWGSRTRPRQLTCGVRRRARTR